MKSKLDQFTPEQRSATLDQINEMFLSGIGRLDIREAIKSLSPVVDLTNSDVDELLSQASIMLVETTPLDRNQIVLIHIGHYEHIFNFFQNINNTEGMNKVLRAKERLLGMVSGPKLSINNKTSIATRPAPVYDWDRLTLAEQERLKFLLDKGDGKK